jgi:hypothetical protein
MVERVVRRVVREELSIVCARPAVELAALAVSVSTVRAMISDGRLPAVKIGRAVQRFRAM